LKISTIFGICIIIIIIAYLPTSNWIERIQLKHQLKIAIETFIKDECGVEIVVKEIHISNNWGGMYYQAESIPVFNYLEGEIRDHGISISSGTECGQEAQYRLNENTGKFEKADSNSSYQRRGNNLEIFIFIFLIIFGPAVWFLLRINRR
jgi:hypothetical protein